MQIIGPFAVPEDSKSNSSCSYSVHQLLAAVNNLVTTRSVGPGLESQALHLCLFQFVIELWREKDENKRKRGRDWLIFFKNVSNVSFDLLLGQVATDKGIKKVSKQGVSLLTLSSSFGLCFAAFEFFFIAFRFGWRKDEKKKKKQKRERQNQVTPALAPFHYSPYWKGLKIKINLKCTISGCGAVGRAVTSYIRDPRFEYSHRQFY